MCPNERSINRHACPLTVLPARASGHSRGTGSWLKKVTSRVALAHCPAASVPMKSNGWHAPALSTTRPSAEKPLFRNKWIWLNEILKELDLNQYIKKKFDINPWGLNDQLVVSFSSYIRFMRHRKARSKASRQRKKKSRYIYAKLRFALRNLLSSNIAKLIVKWPWLENVSDKSGK